MIQTLLAAVTRVGVVNNTVILYSNTKKVASKNYPTNEEAFRAFLDIAKETARAH